MVVVGMLAKRNWRSRTLLHPAGWVRCKLPNLVGPNAVREYRSRPEYDELVVEHSETTGQNIGCAGRQSPPQRCDTIGDRVIAEYATGAGLGG